jgi:tetratricopeptide (TPR) repeat protein
LPLLGFLPFEFQCLSTTADHYLYLPMLGVAVAVAWFVLKYPGRWTTGISLLILVTLAVRSFFQESSWKDARSLLDHALTVNPHSVIAFDGLGFLTSRDAHRLGAAGQLDAARKLFDESIRLYKTSLEYDPMSVPSRINLALDYQQIDRLDLARQQIYAVIALQPKLQPGMRADPISIARFLIDFRDIPGAVDWLETVLRGDPGNRAAFMLYREAVRHLPGPTTIHSSERDPMPDMKNRSVLAGDAVDVSYNH